MADKRDPLLFLLRHGETEWSVSGQHTGRTDIPLTERGRAQAKAAGATLAGEGVERPLVLASPRQRAVVTAELAGLGVPSEVTEDLGEWDYGDYEGITTPQIRETVPGWTVWTHPMPGGESAAQVAARADRVLAKAREGLVERDVVLVGHGHFSRVLVARWLGLPAAAGVHFQLGTAGVAVLGFERGVPQVVRLNLPPAV
ncbi:putative phosphoglycerate mutase [Crossiella equi]|uniref:Phosphoglycerate mutase n=1 Tax=Crossiella equi TaxID=130796 RepID=A0ABS5AD84_9PSEU|nr:acid phosphatase [Crossiella equi]MBP2474532.1 putative phosphoglycerate mutase [Crossiella equi]